jgi:hypothetical protein
MSRDFEYIKMKNYTTIILILLSFMLFNCSRDLSRSEARKQILGNIPKHLQIFQLQFRRGYTTGSIQDVYRSSLDNGMPEGSGEILNKTIDLFLTKNPIVESEWNPLLAPFVGTDPSGFRYVIPLAEANDIEILGISGSSNDSYREVEFNVIYKWNYLATSLGFDYDLKLKSRLHFKKYDDGWRLDR